MHSRRQYWKELKIKAVWNIVPYSLEVDRRFRGTYYKGDRNYEGNIKRRKISYKIHNTYSMLTKITP
jgi:hypothetical protein